MKRLKASPNQRYLIDEDGKGFFYLADTAWELFHRCDREEADLYLEDRAAKGYTAIQAVALAELDGLNTPNPYGHRPLTDNDPTRPNEAYWEHVDDVIERGNALGMYMALLPTWGDKFNDMGKGREIFNAQNARAYGRWIGGRYADKGIIWVLGGDRVLATEEHLAIVRAMAEGIEEGDGGRNLKTFHPRGGYSSSAFVQCEPWLDFNMMQSGHGLGAVNYRMIETDRQMFPRRPTLDGEPAYENHPKGFNQEAGWFTALDVRRRAYWGVFSGACGHTYGCHDIWQMLTPERSPISVARSSWKEALSFPGAEQMKHLRALIEPHIPDDLEPMPLLVDRRNPYQGGERQAVAIGGADKRWALLYLPENRSIRLDLSQLDGDRFKAQWFDPQTGEWQHRSLEVQADPEALLTPPPRGDDWVLKLGALS